MTSLTFLRQALLDFLTAAKIPALGAFPTQTRQRFAGPTVVASVQELRAQPAGFQNYLGDCYDKTLGRWEERFGLGTSVTFQLDIYSPQEAGEDGLRLLMDQVAEAFSDAAPAGLRVKELSWGTTTYDRSAGLFCAKGAAACEGVLYAGMDVDGGFLGFEVRGGITIE